MTTTPATTEPTIEIVNGDLPLSDRAIDALADLLIAADNVAGQPSETGNHPRKCCPFQKLER